MNKHELELMDTLKNKAEEKIPSYEKQIKELECKIKELERSNSKFNPEIVIAITDSIKSLFAQFPKCKFEITAGFDRYNQIKLSTIDVCPI